MKVPILISVSAHTVNEPAAPPITDVQTFSPKDQRHFGLKLNLEIGEAGDTSGNLFSVTVCTPSWFADNLLVSDIQEIHGVIFCNYWDWQKINARILSRIEESASEKWSQISLNLSYYFSNEDYFEIVNSLEKHVY